jgi:hypothetical protein
MLSDLLLLVYGGRQIRSANRPVLLSNTNPYCVGLIVCFYFGLRSTVPEQSKLGL